MDIFLTILHVFVCFFLIFIVLLQSGKGAQMGASFGGASQTLFGARGATTFQSKLTTGAAIVYMLTSLLLTVFASKVPSLVPETPVKETTPGKPMQQTPVDIKEGAVEGEHKGQPQEGQQSVIPPPPPESTAKPSTEGKKEVSPPAAAPSPPPVNEEGIVLPITPEQHNVPDTSTTSHPVEKDTEPGEPSSDSDQKQETLPVEPKNNP